MTGGSKGIGLAIARNLQHAGHEVLICSRNDPLTSESGLAWRQCDLSDTGNLPDLMAWAGHVDILVNNAGGGGRYGTNQEVWNKNVHSMTALTEWALKGMLDAKWGRIVTIGSIFGREAGAPRPIFSAAKAAQIAYMKVMARDHQHARNGITFNTVCPGNTFVEGKPRVDEEALPMGRMGKTSEIARVVAFLCDTESAYINGCTFVVDGGESRAL